MTTEHWKHHEWRAMGSTASAVVFGPQPDQLVAWAVTEIERLEASWSRFRPDSELNELNRAAGAPAVVSPTLWLALDAAAQAWAETGGRFDPTVLSALTSLGYDRSFAEVAPDRAEPAHSSPAPGFTWVALNARSRTVRLPIGVGLDLGGIGKGLAADLVADGLVDRGARSVAVSLGGDVRVAGEGPHDGAWMIPVSRPTDDAPLGCFPLIDEALVQSTTMIRSWRAGGRRLHHIVDPATGWPAETGVAAVIVTGTRAARSEAFAKAALIAGPTAGRALLDEADLDGWFVDASGHVQGTHRVAADLVMGRLVGSPLVGSIPTSLAPPP